MSVPIAAMNHSFAWILKKYTELRSDERYFDNLSQSIHAQFVGTG